MKKLFLCLLFIFVPNILLAQGTPSVRNVYYKGLLENDRVITIYGQNFGIKETAAPVEWEDWESYELTEDPDIPIETATDGKWDLSWGSASVAPPEDPDAHIDHKPYITVENARYENNRSLIKENTRDDLNAPWDLMYNSEIYDLTDEKIILSFWLRYIRMDNPVDGYLPQVKIAEFLHDTSGGHTSHPSFLYAVNAGSNWYKWNMYCNSSALDPQPDCYLVNPPDDAYATLPLLPQYVWTRQMTLIDKGTLCIEDGQLIYTARGHGVTPRMYSPTYGDSIPSITIKTMKLSYRADGTDYQRIVFNGYLANVPYELAYHNEINFDDIYIDNTWQRVEIGNNSVYELCTELELQIPTYWDNGKIVVTGNIATLAQYNRNLYLFVINENNVASNGFKIYPSFVARPEILQVETNR